MMVRLGDTLPDMEVNTTKGKFKLHEWVGDGWGAIFSYPGEPLGRHLLDLLGILTPDLAEASGEVLRRTVHAGA